MAPSSEWTIKTLKEHIDNILADRDTALQTAFSSSQSALDKADVRLDGILQGFPQEYARKTEFESLRTEISNIKLDHVQRREFDQLKDTQTQNRGARNALAGVAGIIITLIAVALGAMYANQLTSADVSGQIARETPKPEVNARLQALETQVILLKTQLATHEATDKLRVELSRKK